MFWFVLIIKLLLFNYPSSNISVLLYSYICTERNNTSLYSVKITVIFLLVFRILEVNGFNMSNNLFIIKMNNN